MTIIVDTNVISELRRFRAGKANPNVVAWAERVPRIDWYLSSIIVMELETGVLRVESRDPVQGARLRFWLDCQVLPGCSDQILPVDTVIAQRCARLHVPDQRPDRDALIAATALVHGMTLVTRNTADFEATGVRLLNPWLAPP